MELERRILPILAIACSFVLSCYSLTAQLMGFGFLLRSVNLILFVVTLLFGIMVINNGNDNAYDTVNFYYAIITFLVSIPITIYGSIFLAIWTANRDKEPDERLSRYSFWLQLVLPLTLGITTIIFGSITINQTKNDEN
jgi:cytochrome bd-type quinol oxidase subunit 2